MKFWSVLFFLLFFQVLASAQVKPWYLDTTIQDFEMNVHFDSGRTDIKNYYDFHLNNYAKYIKSHKDHRIVIVHKDTTPLSKFRALRLRQRLVRSLGVPRDKVQLHTGTPPKYVVSEGENLVVFMRSKHKFSKKMFKPLVRRPAVKKRIITKAKPDVIYIPRAKKIELQEYSAGVGLRTYSFSNVDKDLQALSFEGEAKKRIGSTIFASLEGGVVFSESSVASNREYGLALGLEGQFDNFSLSTKVYGRRNWAWVESDSKFTNVNDLGLHQGLEFNLVRRAGYALTASVWAEFSLSNTISSLASTNVVSFQSEINLELFKRNSIVSLYRLSRKYEVFDARVLGLNFRYKF